eukprot:TRINITY_DN4304_c0_g1_i4.p2 TRINITY_DN4304_c0_g1~~TRINITY_DN4304_c0_g1_i4.p2  ORF type:complete len:183 (-),score=60.53 TRINITY_DN4304_c0_g1_i4:42-590(-)
MKENSVRLAPQMTVTLDDSAECKLNWQLVKTFPYGSTHTKLEIAIDPECTIKPSQMFVVTFLVPTLITDLGGNALGTTRLKTNAKSFRYTSAGEQAAISAIGTGFTSSSMATFGVMLGFSLFQSAAMDSFWVFLNMVQLISYLPLLKVTVPSNLSVFLTEYLTIAHVPVSYTHLTLPTICSV